jgi:hypothetical protein
MFLWLRNALLHKFEYENEIHKRRKEIYNFVNSENILFLSDK